MGVTQFQVVFDQPSALYYCGQTLAGQIHLTVDEPLEVRGVVIRITGSAEVMWKETHSHNHRSGRKTHRTTKTVTYYSTEIYFGDSYYAVGGPEGRIILAPGQHIYTFQKLLGLNLPSNFEGSYGSVRYSVEGSLDRPWNTDNKCLALFTVISPIDLRLHPTARFPIERVVEKKFSYIWRSAGNMTLTINMPFSGYVSGQQIPITVSIENNSEVEITEVTCRLRSTVDFLAMHPHRKTKREKTSLGMVRFGPVNMKSSKTTTRNLDVPLMPSYNVMPCSVIDMNFDLKFEVSVGMFHRDVEVRIPLVIGTIPVVDIPVSSAHGYANTDGIPAGPMTAFTPGTSQNNLHGDHARLMVAAPSGQAAGAMTAFTSAHSQNNLHGDHPRQMATAPPGQAIDDLPPPYHVAIQGLPMHKPSMC